MMMRPMKTAPHNGTGVVIITPVAAHKAEWDGAFSNFWSDTAQRALADDECLGWMTTTEWMAFALSQSGDREVSTPEDGREP